MITVGFFYNYLITMTDPISAYRCWMETSSAAAPLCPITNGLSLRTCRKEEHGAIRGPQHRVAGSDGDIMEESPAKACLIEKRSVASTSSYQFGGERMIKACNGLLERQSLEESCMIAAGEDISCMLPSILPSMTSDR